MYRNANPLFTVIVPAYNASDTIERCIKSLIAQTFADFEVILIDDGSKDDTVRLTKRLTKNDKRFQLICQANMGVSQARNAGLEVAKGSYIVFVDSDDVIETHTLAEFATIINHDSHYALIMSGMVQRSNSKETSFIHNFDNRGNATLFEADVPKLISSKQLLSPCAKAYSRKVISNNSIRFRQGLNIGEDLTFNLNFFKHTQTYKSTPYIGYIYMTDSAGSLSKRVTNQTFNDYEKLFRQNIRFCKSLGLGRKASASFAMYYLASVYYGLTMGEGSWASMKNICGEIVRRGSVKEASRIMNKADLQALFYTLPVYLNSSRLLALGALTRRFIKKALR